MVPIIYDALAPTDDDSNSVYMMVREQIVHISNPHASIIAKQRNQKQSRGIEIKGNL